MSRSHYQLKTVSVMTSLMLLLTKRSFECLGLTFAGFLKIVRRPLQETDGVSLINRYLSPTIQTGILTLYTSLSVNLSSWAIHEEQFPTVCRSYLWNYLPHDWTIIILCYCPRDQGTCISFEYSLRSEANAYLPAVIRKCSYAAA